MTRNRDCGPGNARDFGTASKKGQGHVVYCGQPGPFHSLVFPAKAGIQQHRRLWQLSRSKTIWIPACAGKTGTM